MTAGVSFSCLWKVDTNLIDVTLSGGISKHTQILDKHRCAHLTSSDVNWAHITGTVCVQFTGLDVK